MERRINMYCRNCGKEIDDKAVICPGCGFATANMKNMKKKKPIFKRWWFWVLIAVALIVIVSSIGGNQSDPPEATLSTVAGNTPDMPPAQATTQATETTPTTVPETTIDPAVAEAEYRESCQAVDYKDLCRYPDDYVGTNIYVEVKIYQIMDVGGLFSEGTAWRGLTDNSGYDLYFDDEYYLLDKRPEGAVKILKDDIIVVYGEFTGLEEVTRVLTYSQEEIPRIEVKYVDIIE